MISDSATYVSYDKNSERYYYAMTTTRFIIKELLKKPQKGEMLI